MVDVEVQVHPGPSACGVIGMGSDVDVDVDVSHVVSPVSNHGGMLLVSVGGNMTMVVVNDTLVSVSVAVLGREKTTELTIRVSSGLNTGGEVG